MNEINVRRTMEGVGQPKPNCAEIATVTLNLSQGRTGA
jgi:hypothetical protein